MTLPVLVAALPEITPGGKLIVGFWATWIGVMLVGFLFKAFRTDDLEIAPVEQTEPPHAH